jgi:Family of unknown function (DUF6530)
VTEDPDPRGLRHRPLVLLDYAAHDGFYLADRTDCRYISLGWAQYDPRQLSVKTLRHTGDRWSRQSEELPLHRCLDAALLIAAAVDQVPRGNSVSLAADVLERQHEPAILPVETETAPERTAFEQKLADPLLLRRLGKLADALEALRKAGRI